MSQDTPYTSPEWLLSIYIPPISVARLPFLHGRSCISGFDTFFRMALLPTGKGDFFGVLICLSRLLLVCGGVACAHLGIFNLQGAAARVDVGSVEGSFGSLCTLH